MAAHRGGNFLSALLYHWLRLSWLLQATAETSTQFPKDKCHRLELSQLAPSIFNTLQKPTQGSAVQDLE